jgi:hypothetical protein
MKHKVSVEQRMYCTGTVTVDCDNPDQAVEMVQNQINKGILLPSAIEWSEPEYEDFSFGITGDVD